MELVEISFFYLIIFEIEINIGLVCLIVLGIILLEVCMKFFVSDNYIVYNYRVYIGDIREI